MRLSQFDKLTQSAACIVLATSIVAASGSHSVNVADRLFDEYGRIRWADEQARLDNFAITLQQDPKLVGYVTVYAGRISCAGEAQRHALKIKNYLVRRRQIEPTRILWLDAGYADSFVVVLQPADRDANIIFPVYPSLLAKDVRVTKCKTVRHGKRA
jgi:hypothetical protein